MHCRGIGGASVVAFEVHWDDIGGLDYCNPLCEDGRIVFEARHVLRFVFRTVVPVQHHAGFPTSLVPVAHWQNVKNLS